MTFWEVGELLLGGVGHLDRLDRLAAAKNRDVVGDAHDLAHLVRDEDNRLALVGEGAHDVE